MVDMLIDTVLLILGIIGVNKFYFSRVNGDFAYQGFIDALAPRLQLNPPNISIILYSLGIILLIYILCASLSKNKLIETILKYISILGRYSLDIFIWHMYIHDILVIYFNCISENMWLRRLVFYIVMFGIPIAGRKIYMFLKRDMYAMKVI